MMERPSIVEFVTDTQLLGLSVSPAQEALLRSIYGLPLIGEHLDLFRACTGREQPAAGGYGEVTTIAGGRSGKDSRIAGPIVCFEALFGGHEAHLHRGERGILPLVAQDARGTRIAYGYIKDYLTRSPLLASQVAEVRASEIELTNGLSVYTFPCTQRSLRGWSIPCGVMDELGFYALEGAADSDVEIQTSIRRGMIGFPSPRLVKVSTPYMKSGVLYGDFTRAWGQDDPDLLVWRASTALMNPTIGGLRLALMRRLDPSRYAREFEAEFAEDVAAFLPAAWVDAAVIPGRHELPPRPGVVYLAAVDPSGGGRDAFTLAVVHTEGLGENTRVFQDVLRGWARVGSQLSGVVAEIAEILTRFGCREVVGDRYAAGFTREAFQRAGIMYRESPSDASGEYLETEPLLAQGRLELLDHPTLRRELTMLERRPRAGGRPLIVHPTGGHDDYANATCRAIAAIAAVRPFEGSIAAATFLGKPRASARLFASGLPRHTDEAEYDRRAIWKDSPWGDLR